MATFNGKEEDLRFSCKACNLKQHIDVDLDNEEDKDKLWKWLKVHSANGGEYKNVPSLENIAVEKRTNEQHQELIKKYGGVREYLLSMGKFKDVPLP